MMRYWYRTVKRSATSLNKNSSSHLAQSIYCGGVEARYISGRRPAIVKVEMTGDAKNDGQTKWQRVGWIYLLDVARNISF